MNLPRWARPKPALTSREAYEEIWRRRKERGIEAPPPIIVDPLDDPDECETGCHPDNLFRVIDGPTLVGSMICLGCGTVYRKETP